MKNSEGIKQATHEGIININGFEIRSYNLDSGERVLSRIDFLRAIGRTGKAKGGRAYDKDLPVFLSANNLQPYIGKELMDNMQPINFMTLKGTKSIGYKAELLPSVCYVFIDASDNGPLPKNQKHIAEHAKLLVRGFATIGIIALIDAATGFEDVRRKDALQRILDAYLRKEYAAWAKCFPDEFYEEMFRLKNWTLDKRTMKMPQVVGRYTNDIIYDRLAPGILDELRRKNPVVRNGQRKAKHHQFLTSEVGHPELDRHLSGIMALMRASTTWDQFKRSVERAFPRIGNQLALRFLEDVNQ